MQPDVLPPTLTVLDVAAYLGISKPTVDRKISSGELKSYKIGRLRRVRREALLEYVEQLEQTTAETTGKHLMRK